MEKINVFWFRRDLRINDNHALFNALKSGLKVVPIFIFDKDILKEFPNTNDRRLNFIYKELKNINNKLLEFNSSILIFNSTVKSSFENLLQKFNVNAVFYNKDYEPYATKRDSEIELYLKERGIEFKGYKDHVIFETNEIVKPDKTPYTVFTPYSKKWKLLLETEMLKTFESEELIKNFLTFEGRFPTLKELGYNELDYIFPKSNFNKNVIRSYETQRNFPHLDGGSKLGVHLRFGTISIRTAVNNALKFSDCWLNELIWREFFIQLMWHFPKNEHFCFKQKYNYFEWLNDEAKFDKWCKAETGFQIVDAGIRELIQTGYMHNRVRMITANFLTKLLQIDWRWGERFFAEHLLDYELAINNGNWQWAAGTGADAAPYFRIFNPLEQIKKFDSNNIYIDKWLPKEKYKQIKPIVDYKVARSQYLERFSQFLKNENR